jgi:PAS domain S-box-containing protein
MPQQTSRGPVRSGGGARMGVRKRAIVPAPEPSEADETASTPLRSKLEALGGAGHLCSLYETRQECSDILLTFLEVGIARGEKCLCVVSGGSEKALRKALRAANPRIYRAVVAQAVDLTTIEREYFTYEGLLTQRTLDFWRKASEQAVAEGFMGLRGIVQVDRALGGPAVLARWIEYENRLTQVLLDSGGTMLCLYNRSAQPAEFVRDAFRAHAIVAHQDGIGKNTFYVPPEEYAAPDKANREVRRMLLSLGERWRGDSVSRAAPRKLLQKAWRRFSGVLRTMEACERVTQRLAADLKEYERKQQQLRRYMGYLTLGQQITHTGSWAWNCSTGELFWSREHFRIFGLDPTRTNVSYQLFFKMVHPEERARVEREFLEAVRSVRDFDGEYRIVRPDGVVKYLHSRAFPVFGKPGELTEYVGTVADVTERRHGEESVGRMQAELARASSAITLGQLMASIAHQVNQPLAALVANASAALRWLAWDEPQIDKAQQALARIVRDGNRASEIIARIRALVRKSDALRNPLSLNSIVHEVIALLKAELRGNNVTVRTDLAERLPPIRGDRVQIQQVLLNLIMNAIEAMSAVTTRPRLLAIATISDAAGVVVSVEDCGIGLDERMLERVFEPFYSSKPQGMGIGLAISRSIIEAHGGRLWAVRNRVSGATFRFRLPFGEGDAK